MGNVLTGWVTVRSWRRTLHNAVQYSYQDLMSLWNVHSGISRTLNIIWLEVVLPYIINLQIWRLFLCSFADLFISFVGSPFVCKVLDASQVLISGSALKMSPLGRTAVVTVDPQISAGDLGSCDVTVTSPSGQTIPVRLTKTDKFTAEFMPTEVGEF